MGVDRFIDILPKVIHTTLDGPYTLRQAFLQINSIQVQPQDIPSDGEPMTIPGDTANEQQARVDDLGDFFFEDGFSHTSGFN